MKKSIYLFALVAILLSSCNYEDSGSYLNSSYYEDFQQNEKYTDYGENPFIKVADQNQSTFGIDADGGSYSNARRFLNLAQLPPTESVRIEEFINYFTFDYEDPTSENVAINTEAAVCPWNENHLLLRIGLKGKSLSSNEIGASNFVFLIDVSGSMSSPDKLQLLKSGFKMMVDEMNENDRIAIVSYAGADKIVLQSTSCDDKKTIKAAIDKLGSGGSTAGAKGLITAYQIAIENFIEGGNNRVILGSDGDFNVGPSSNEELVTLIEEKRESGVYLTVLGVGQGNINDSMMEQLANNGNGNYEYIDNVNQLKKVFIYEKQKFYTVAKDCKIQVSFLENSVDSFRLIGYENRVLENSEFENDSTDAGEIGAGQTITAFYEIVPKLGSTGDFCTLELRYKLPDESISRLITYGAINQAKPFGEASRNMRFGAAVAGFGLLMKQSKYMGDLTLNKVQVWAMQAKGTDPYEWKEEFIDLIETAKSLD